MNVHLSLESMWRNPAISIDLGHPVNLKPDSRQNLFLSVNVGESSTIDVTQGSSCYGKSFAALASQLYIRSKREQICLWPFSNLPTIDPIFNSDRSRLHWIQLQDNSRKKNVSPYHNASALLSVKHSKWAYCMQFLQLAVLHLLWVSIDLIRLIIIRLIL